MIVTMKTFAFILMLVHGTPDGTIHRHSIVVDKQEQCVELTRSYIKSVMREGDTIRTVCMPTLDI